MGRVPSTFRILRALLSRLEDETTGEIRVPELHVEMPPDRVKELEACLERGFPSGVTTNPMLVARSGCTDFGGHIRR